MSKIADKYFKGRGGVLELLPIAIPMFLSSMFDMLMMFVDRLFLSHVGVVHQAAAMSGGVTSWMVVSFFAGIVGYSSALIAQYHGAGQKGNCTRMVWQSLMLGLASYPLVLLIDLAVSHSPVFSAHSALEQELERRYFWYMAFGTVFALMRFSFSSFFSGIGRTKVIMAANVVAMVVNIFANWVLIFGHLGFPALGLDGAAIGTLLSSFSAVALIAARFFRERLTEEWRDATPGFFDAGKLLKLLRYGLPQGVENVLGMMGFVCLLSAFHSYGDDMATATTICFNWDNFSFHPLMGVQVAVTTLVGQFMGAGEPRLAARSARSGFIAALLYSFCVTMLFVTCAPQLVGVFTPASSGLDYAGVRAYALPMLRLCGLYLMTDAVLLVSSGVLRGAGDTFWCMVVHLAINLTNAACIVFSVRVLQVKPLQAWTIFVVFGILGSTAIFTRYRLGHWKKLRIIEGGATTGA